MLQFAFLINYLPKPALGGDPWNRGSNPTKNAKLQVNLPNPLPDARLDSAQQIAEKIAASRHH